jgi:hypothetical protein
MKTSQLSSLRWQILIGVLLAVAILNKPMDIDLPYGYFIFLRFACCAAFSFWALAAHENQEPKWRNAFVVIALLYNPFLPVKLGDPVIWMLVNIATLFFVVASGRLTKASVEGFHEGLLTGDLDNVKSKALKSQPAGNEKSPPNEKSDPPKLPPELPKPPAKPGGQKLKEEVIHFVMPPLPPGVLSGKDRPITAKVIRTIDQDGKHGATVIPYAGADILTMSEAFSATYWRNQIEEKKITDAQVIDWMHSVELQTPQDYIMASSDDPHPGEVAITCGLTQISLHYVIGYADEVFGDQTSAMNWIVKERAKGAKSKRVRDFEKGNNLKKALCTGEIDAEFISHINASVNGKPKE